MQIGSWENANSVLELGEQIPASGITAPDLESTTELVDGGAEAESGKGMVAKLVRLLGLPEQDHLRRSGLRICLGCLALWVPFMIMKQLLVHELLKFLVANDHHH